MSSVNSLFFPTTHFVSFLPIKFIAPPVDGNFREVSPRCGCGEMCLNQVGLYSPRIHYCYQSGRDYYWFNPKKWGDRCENNPDCHMVDSRAYFDCGYENKWGDNDDYFCANDRHEKNTVSFTTLFLFYIRF